MKLRPMGEEARRRRIARLLTEIEWLEGRLLSRLAALEELTDPADDLAVEIRRFREAIEA